MKKILLAVLFLLSLLAAGCAARYVDVRGEKFEMISESEEKELVEHARLSLKTISRRIPPRDMRVIDTTVPETRFIYSGDRYGKAVIKWQFPKYEAGVEYEGELMTKHMTSSVFTQKKRPEVVDFTRRVPAKRFRPVPAGRNNKIQQPTETRK